ncbi:MAG: hypothetical protein AAGF15_12350, partial [Pseudomonadota bacterium]
MFFNRFAWGRDVTPLGNIEFSSFSFQLPFYFGSPGRDSAIIDYPTWYVNTFGRPDDIVIKAPSLFVDLGRGADMLEIWSVTGFVDLGRGRDTMVAEEFVFRVEAGRGADNVTLKAGAQYVDMGRGRDQLTLDSLVAHVDGGLGRDLLTLNFEAGGVDIEALEDGFVFKDRFSGETMTVESFETIQFSDRSFTQSEMRAVFDAEIPYIQVGGGTQVVTINDPDPTVSVIWDRTVQQAVIDSSEPAGPTIASRAYAMMHTAMYDAWSSY